MGMEAAEAGGDLRLELDRVLLRKTRPDVRVLLSSGYSEQEAIRRFEGRGLAGFLQKPYRLHELSDRLRAILDPGA